MPFVNIMDKPETGRVQFGVPVLYRLARKPDGELVLQGAYKWQERNSVGIEWLDIPTVEIDT